MGSGVDKYALDSSIYEWLMGEVSLDVGLSKNCCGLRSAARKY